jgi:hypothetical protein
MHPVINSGKRSDVEQAQRYQIYAAHLWKCGQKYLNKGLAHIAIAYFDGANNYYDSARRLMKVE